MKNKNKLFLIATFFFLSSCQQTVIYHNQPSTPTKLQSAARINVQLGMAYLERNDYDRAREKFLTATQEGPTLPEVWYSMAYFQEITHNNTLANDYYLKAISLSPQSGAARNNYGTFLCHQGHYQEAIQQFLQAVQDANYLTPADAYANAGLCALKIPDKMQAKQFFLKALTTDPRREISKKQLQYL